MHLRHFSRITGPEAFLKDNYAPQAFLKDNYAPKAFLVYMCGDYDKSLHYMHY